MGEKMKLGFFGGCFNPPSNIHVNLAKDVLIHFNLDKVFFVPVGNYYKKNGLVDSLHRYNMLKLSIDGINNIEIEDIVLNYKEKLYAIDTFKLIKQKYKNDDLFFIMGSDNFRNISSWNNYQELINDFNIIVIERERIVVRNEAKSNIYEYIPEALSPVDSTKIRNMIKANKSTDKYLNKEVIKYIIKNKLYI